MQSSHTFLMTMLSMNPQLRYFVIFVISSIIFYYLFFGLKEQPADTLYVNARIYTMDADNTVAEALAIKDGRIIGVGPTASINSRFEADRIIDLKGKTVLPGFIDAHAHLLSLGVAKLTLDLVGTSSEAEIADLVKERVAKSSSGLWIRGRGWDQNDWPSKRFPTHRTLDRVSGDYPVYLARIDGHAVWVNKRTMELAGITKSTPDPAGGKIIRDPQGNPTGVLIDEAMQLVGKILPPLTDEEAEEALKLAIQECLKYGITCVHDMGVDSRGLDLYKRMIDRGEFPFRVYAAIEAPGEFWNAELSRGPLIGYGGHKLTVRAIKLYVDGALGSRGAALIEPYSDDPGNRGLTVTSEESLRKSVDEALAHGFQVCTHAIGDRGNNIVLNVYEAALRAHAVRDHRLRVEHAQALYPGDIPRFRSLRVIPSMQPTHCTSDMYWAEARLGATRIRSAYAWRSLLFTGVIIAGGSDFPVEHPDPLLGIYAAVSRQDQQGVPQNAEDVRKSFELSKEGIVDPAAFEGGWYASEKMTVEEAVRSFTGWAAYAGFGEKEMGSIERGKLADFVVLSRDILALNHAEILKTKVERTILGGKEVYILPGDVSSSQ